MSTPSKQLCIFFKEIWYLKRGTPKWYGYDKKSLTSMYNFEQGKFLGLPGFLAFRICLRIIVASLMLVPWTVSSLTCFTLCVCCFSYQPAVSDWEAGDNSQTAQLEFQHPAWSRAAPHHLLRYVPCPDHLWQGRRGQRCQGRPRRRSKCKFLLSSYRPCRGRPLLEKGPQHQWLVVRGDKWIGWSASVYSRSSYLTPTGLSIICRLT